MSNPYDKPLFPISPTAQGMEIGRWELQRAREAAKPLFPIPTSSPKSSNVSPPLFDFGTSTSRSSGFDYSSSDSGADFTFTPLSPEEEEGCLNVFAGIALLFSGIALYSAFEKQISPFLPYIGIGAAGIAGAGAIYGTYKVVDHLMDDVSKAVIITAGIYGTLGLGTASVMGFNAYQNHLAEKYPHLTASINMAGDFRQLSTTKELPLLSLVTPTGCKVNERCDVILTTEFRSPACYKIEITDRSAGKFPTTEITRLYKNGHRNNVDADPYCTRQFSSNGHMLSCQANQVFYCNNPDTLNLLRTELERNISTQPERLSFETYALEKNLFGIGIELSTHGKDVIIKGLIHNGPAHQAGLRGGDIVTAINGAVITSGKTEDVSSKITNTQKDAVSLTIQRGTETFDVAVAKDLFLASDKHYYANAEWVPSSEPVLSTSYYRITVPTDIHQKPNSFDTDGYKGMLEPDSCVARVEGYAVQRSFLKVAGITADQEPFSGYVEWKNLEIAQGATPDTCVAEFR